MDRRSSNYSNSHCFATEAGKTGPGPRKASSDTGIRQKAKPPPCLVLNEALTQEGVASHTETAASEQEILTMKTMDIHNKDAQVADDPGWPSMCGAQLVRENSLEHM